MTAYNAGKFLHVPFNWSDAPKMISQTGVAANCRIEKHNGGCHRNLRGGRKAWLRSLSSV